MPSLKGITVSVEQVNALSVLGISMGTGSTTNGVEHRYVQGPLPEKNVAYWKSEGDIRVGDFHEAATIIRDREFPEAKAVSCTIDPVDDMEFEILLDFSRVELRSHTFQVYVVYNETIQTKASSLSDARCANGVDPRVYSSLRIGLSLRCQGMDAGSQYEMFCVYCVAIEETNGEESSTPDSRNRVNLIGDQVQVETSPTSEKVVVHLIKSGDMGANVPTSITHHEGNQLDCACPPELNNIPCIPLCQYTNTSPLPGVFATFRFQYTRKTRGVSDANPAPISEAHGVARALRESRSDVAVMNSERATGPAGRGSERNAHIHSSQLLVNSGGDTRVSQQHAPPRSAQQYAPQPPFDLEGYPIPPEFQQGSSQTNHYTPPSVGNAQDLGSLPYPHDIGNTPYQQHFPQSFHEYQYSNSLQPLGNGEKFVAAPHPQPMHGGVFPPPFDHVPFRYRTAASHNAIGASNGRIDSAQVVAGLVGPGQLGRSIQGVEGALPVVTREDRNESSEGGGDVEEEDDEEEEEADDDDDDGEEEEEDVGLREEVRKLKIEVDKIHSILRLLRSRDDAKRNLAVGSGGGRRFVRPPTRASTGPVGAARQEQTIQGNHERRNHHSPQLDRSTLLGGMERQSHTQPHQLQQGLQDQRTYPFNDAGRHMFNYTAPSIATTTYSSNPIAALGDGNYARSEYQMTVSGPESLASRPASVSIASTSGINHTYFGLNEPILHHPRAVQLPHIGSLLNLDRQGVYDYGHTNTAT